jgi:hypothetical protein
LCGKYYQFYFVEKLVRIFAFILLLFNGFGALYGGWQLISHPDGSSIGLPLELLKSSPFKDYLVPGIVLFVGNGLFSVFTAGAMPKKFRYTGWLICAQGVFLIGWLVIQIYLIQMLFIFHYIMGATGLLLACIGLWLMKRDKAREY